MPLLATSSTDSSSGPFSGVGDFFSSGYFTAIERVGALFVIAIWLALAFGRPRTRAAVSTIP